MDEKFSKEDLVYCLKAFSNLHSETCDDCKYLGQCDHSLQDALFEKCINILEGTNES